jgi:DNA polymerase-3 subunit alpha
MEPNQFVHLRLHTEFSVSDGLVRIDEALQAADDDAQVALAITDMSNLFGAIKFYKAARAKGIKPIIGCDVWIASDDREPTFYRLLLLAKNRTGYLQICELVSRAWLENNKGRAAIRYEWLVECLAQAPGALIALSGGGEGDVGRALLERDAIRAENLARRWKELMPEHFYLEVQRYGQPEMDRQVLDTVALAIKVGLPVVATHPVQFLEAQDFTAHEARVCVAQGEKLSSTRRKHDFTERQHFMTRSEMCELFADLPVAVLNTIQIAQRCSSPFDLNKPQLPDFPLPAGISADAFLASEAAKGLELRLERLFPDSAERQRERARYDERLQFEVATICNMKFPGYFLIVAEFIRWAKSNGVPVGPGRGSGAGSLVAYALSITDLDPLAFNLLFERFLNPERVSMPDFDIDFCQDGRDRVIQHVKDLYGKGAVSQIATFGTMAAKGAVRDIVRVLDMPHMFGDGLSRLIPATPGKHVTLSGALESEPAFAERYAREEDVRRVIDLAKQVEGITRSIGTHAGGVLIAPGKLTDFCPLYAQEGDSGVISQFDKDDVEAVGLVKFDFLGLTTLTVLDLAVHYVRQTDPALSAFALEGLPMDDSETFSLLVRAETVAVFQLESQGMQSMLREARPDRFEDVIALVALYRPGPMDLIPDFCRRKHGEGFTYPDPRTESILAETYGIMVYQEQVMQMAQIVGGYTLGGADLLRRAMGKKKPEEMAAHRKTFREGAARDGLAAEKADEIFDLMEKFAGYGFNKSHAAAYALLSYQTAYLKAHHPAAFMSANLSLAMDDTDKVKILVDDAAQVCGLRILPPDINLSGYRFEPQPGGNALRPSEIRYGLGAVKGCGRSAIEHIVSVRGARPFSGLFDLIRRTDKKILTKRAVEALIKAGAFDRWGVTRASLLATLPAAVTAASAWQSIAGQGGLFDGDMEREEKPYVATLPWSISEQLAHERSALGFCLSGHPFDAYRREAERLPIVPLAALTPRRDPVLIAGVIESFKVQSGARGRYAVATIEDGRTQVQLTVYSEALARFGDRLVQGAFMAARCRAAPDRFGDGVRLTADRIYDIYETRQAFGKRVWISVPESMDVAGLRALLEPFRAPDGLPVSVNIRRSGVACDFALPPIWRIAPSSAFLEALLQEGVTEACVVY